MVVTEDREELETEAGNCWRTSCNMVLVKTLEKCPSLFDDKGEQAA